MAISVTKPGTEPLSHAIDATRSNAADACQDYFDAARRPRDARLPRTPLPALPCPFGVEIEMVETTLPKVSGVLQRALPGVASNPATHDVYDSYNRAWQVKNDHPNVEIATPILHTHADLILLQRVVTALAVTGMRCDDGTGVHVHVDADALDAQALTYLLALVSQHEPYIFSALQVEARRRLEACRPLSLSWVKRAVRAKPQTIDQLESAFRQDCLSARFVGLNLERIFDGTFGTLEFRYFNGCLEPHVIGCYVGYAMALVQHAATEASDPAPEGAATLPGLLQTLGLGPEHPVSRLFCGALRKTLENKIRSTPRLGELVRAECYSGDAALLLAMSVNENDLESALKNTTDAPAMLARAVAVLRYMPHESTAAAFMGLVKVPSEHQKELAELACDLLDHPRYGNRSPHVFSQLCRVPQPQREPWVNTAKRAPVEVLVSFAPKFTRTLASVFGRFGMHDTTYPGTVALGRKVLDLFRVSPNTVKDRVSAVVDTEYLNLENTDLRGRLVISMLEFTPAQIRHLAQLTGHVLTPIKHDAPEAYTYLLEAFCAGKPESWPAYTKQLQALLSGPSAKTILFGLRTGHLDAEKLLQGEKRQRLLDGTIVGTSLIPISVSSRFNLLEEARA